MRIAFGIDVSKNKSDIVGKNELCEIVYGPITVHHSRIELKNVIDEICKLDGEKLVLMENTSMYWRQPALVFYEYGLKVSVLNAILIHAFGVNTLRNIKTDKADAYKIADYALAYWNELPLFSPENDVRELLKMESRLYTKTVTMVGSMKNNLIALCDQTYPGVNELFWKTGTDSKGHFKWVDYVIEFWHRECVSSLSEEEFVAKYRSWCIENHHRFRNDIARRVYKQSLDTIATFPYNEATKRLVQQTAKTLNSLYDDMSMVREEMYELASKLPEFETVMEMDGVGPVLGPQLMAEIGDVSRFRNKKALVAYAGLDSPPYQSGMFVSKSRHISKKGSGQLRKTVFNVAQVVLLHGNKENEVYDFMCRKRSEGKHYYVYMTATCAKFLRVYYGKVSEAMEKHNNVIL